MKAKDRIALLLKIANLEQIEKGIEALQNEFESRPIFKSLFDNDLKELSDAVEKRIQKKKAMAEERKQNAIQSVEAIIKDLAMVGKSIEMDNFDLDNILDNILDNFNHLGYEIGEIQLNNNV